jgi:hypothetical protein
VWLLDFPEFDSSNYPNPSAKQILYADQARRQLRKLRSTLMRLTVPQQRAILDTIANELVGGVSSASGTTRLA